MFRRALAACVFLTLVSSPASAQTSCSQSLQSLVDAAPAGSTLLAPACTYHEMVTVNHAVVLDGQNRAIIDGDNTRDRWFWIASSNVTIRNFTMRNANTALQEGALATAGGISGVVIDHNVLTGTLNGAAVGIGGTSDSKVTNNDISGAGQLGIETYLDTRLTISGNHLHGNNTAGVDVNFGGGGLKANQDAGLVISDNEADHNVGPGLWVDVGSTSVSISGNLVHNQAYNPIFFEVSSGGEIAGNTVLASNTNPTNNWGCIVVSTSGDVRVHDNACQDTMPLFAQLQPRSDAPADAGQNIVLQNNRLVRPVGGAATVWQGLHGPAACMPTEPWGSSSPFW